MADWTEQAIMVLQKRYVLKDRTGVPIESPDDLLHRVAQAVSRAEIGRNQPKWEERFFNIMDSLEFLPNSPTLMNAGKENGQLSACFVVPVDDSIEAIFNAVKYAALIHKTGGGTGFSFSKIRPAGSLVETTMGVASGPVSFMRVFDAATGAIKQGGVRRGANLGCLNVTHPDIFEFVKCKREVKEFVNFNVSVGILDSFMEAVRAEECYYLFNSHTKQKIKIDAQELFEEICQSIWLGGDPGVLFLDEINRHNCAPWFGKIHTSNPCGELPLHDHGVCNLGSIDVSKFMQGHDLDYARLGDVVDVAVRFLDNVITINSYPNIKIRNKALSLRQIGLGVMGWADLLIKLNLFYDSVAARDKGKELLSFIQSRARKASIKLGKERGVFKQGKKLRNATLTTVAPTGTLSILVNCSSGIEPLFSEIYTKQVLDGESIKFSAPKNNGAVRTTMDISVEDHIKMQATFQKEIDNAVSKTINLPENATTNDIAKALFLAYDLKCKGITLFRNNSKPGVLAIVGDSECDDGRCSI